jgi:hypothetical protein
MSTMPRHHAGWWAWSTSGVRDLSSWRYLGGTRDLRLDLLRGFAVIAMVADHIGGERSWLYVVTGGDRFFISAAEVFVFISGLVMGLIYAGIIAHQGLGAALMKALQRVWTLYLLTVTLTLIFAWISLHLNLSWAFMVTASNFLDFLISVLTLHRAYFLTDVLLLYTLLILGAVPVLVLLAHGYTRTVLAVSWGLWALWQLAPEHATFPWPIADNSVFNFPAWQVLFINALAIGYHRPQLKSRVPRLSPHLLLGISAGFVAGTIAFYVVTQSMAPAYGVTLFRRLFDKADLHIGRLIVFGGFFTCAYALCTVAWRPLCRALSWLLLPLGQSALTAYTLHLFVVALSAKLTPSLLGTVPATAAQNTIIQIAGILLIWAMIRVQPHVLAMVSSWVTTITALMPAKWVSWDLSGHPRHP